MSKSNGKSPKRELTVIAAKLPRGIVVRLDRAASNSWNTRNALSFRSSTRAVFHWGAGQSRQRPPWNFRKVLACPENAHRSVLSARSI